MSQGSQHVLRNLHKYMAFIRPCQATLSTAAEKNNRTIC